MQKPIKSPFHFTAESEQTQSKDQVTQQKQQTTEQEYARTRHDYVPQIKVSPGVQQIPYTAPQKILKGPVQQQQKQEYQQQQQQPKQSQSYQMYQGPKNQTFIEGDISLESPKESKSFSEGGKSWENDPPLLEDLGIDISLVFQKIKAVLLLQTLRSSNTIEEAWKQGYADNTQTQQYPQYYGNEQYQQQQSQQPQQLEIYKSTDMTGPMIILITFGCLLLLTGKLQFGLIYGQIVIGSLGLYLLANLLSQYAWIDLYSTISYLAYALIWILPIILFKLTLTFGLTIVAGTGCV